MSRERMPQAVVDAVYERSEGFCECGYPGVCIGQAQHLHHRQMRSQGGGHTVENVGAVCARCHHDAIHKHTAWSYDAGWLIHGWDDVTWPPRFYRGVMTPREEET